ncbi:MAG: S8 family serine peptidase [Flavobacterium sp.]|uniref:S8 family serine peptidase n=1 Tax=Flavobacterium sp. TaxID=239 RepID=UPI0022C1C59E|nr:S8 family serine peptidase [Flavobacterium sp.]MCZ8198772.1 S8 family serine peptidase [Flavobacterium sp.]
MKIKISLFLAFFSTISIFAQTELQRKKIMEANNSIELNRMALEYDSIFRVQKAEALEKARIKGWDIFKSREKGGFSELMRVNKNGNPVYYTTDNKGAAVTTRANKLNSGGSLGLSLDGQNMNIGVWDGGKVRNTHLLLVGRVTQVDNATALSDHATHVSGTMMGNATASPSAKGMASQANLRAYDWNSDTSEATLAANNGLLVSNHSYGADPDFVPINEWGKYDGDARAYDRIMFNAPYYQFVNSAGNSRNAGYNPNKDGYDLLSGKSTSKNGIIVAAVNQVSNYTSASSVVMSGFSSWGPTDDGRIKPDICGKGVNVRSSISTSNSSYDFYDGTSMASPNVAGTLLLLQQHYNNVKSNYMRASTLRGLALHTADEAGSDPGPDYRFGWGLLNAEKAANLITNEGVSSRIREITLNQGDSYSFNIQPINSTEQLIGSICWTDPAGAVTVSGEIDFFTPSLVNDLDIRIVKNNVTNFPWKLNPVFMEDAATKGDNLVDNIERVDISNPTGTYTVTVSHKGNLTNDLQNYSLIMSNVVNRPILLSTTKPLKNNICQGSDSTFFEFQLETLPTFSGVTTFSVSGLPAGSNASFDSTSLAIASANVIYISNLNLVPIGAYPITVTATSGASTSTLFFTINVQEALVTSPTLVSPVNNAIQIDVNPTITWTNSGVNATNYTIEIAKDANFTDELQTLNSVTNQIDLDNLDFGSTYYWRVKANNICNSSPFSTINSFSTSCNNDIVITVTNETIEGATFTWTNPNDSDTYQIEVVPQGAAPTGIYTTVFTNSYTVTSLNSASNYTIYLRSACSGNTFTTLLNKNFTTLVNHCVDGYFRDSGGLTGNYTNSEYVTTVMSPVNSGDEVSVTFTSFNLENGADNLKIYNGPDTNSPFIVEQYGFTGTNNPGTVTSTHPTGKLTFVFYSDGANTAPGWNATVTCANLATTSYNKTNFTYYPNPASTEVNFKGNETINSISIYTVLGQLVKTEKVNAKETSIDISTLPSGSFFFKVETDSNVNTVKIIKK